MPWNLFTTYYGVLLVGKLVCMAIVAATASVVRFRLLPRIAAGRRTAVAVWCGVGVAGAGAGLRHRGRVDPGPGHTLLSRGALGHVLVAIA